MHNPSIIEENGGRGPRRAQLMNHNGPTKLGGAGHVIGEGAGDWLGGQIRDMCVGCVGRGRTHTPHKSPYMPQRDPRINHHINPKPATGIIVHFFTTALCSVSAFARRTPSLLLFWLSGEISTSVFKACTFLSREQNFASKC